MADVDGDRDVDLACGNGTGSARQQSRLYLNDGSGTFTDVTATRMPPASEATLAVAFADVNLDGDADLVCGNFGQNRLYMNDGTGTLTDATGMRLPPNLDPSSAVAFADVDGDGDPDLVFGNKYNQQNRLCLNDGTGTFSDATAARMPTDIDDTNAVAIGDVDGDGNPDLVFGGGSNRLYLNDGTGTFVDATAALAVLSQAVALGDVDRDGDLDIVFGNSGFRSGQQNRLYLNDGTGTFTDATAAQMPARNDGTASVVLGDVDGDLDLVFGNWYGQNRLYLNLLRQLDVPLPVTRGQPYQLDVYVRYGPTGTVDTAVPFISTGSASIPFPPLGTFALDPAQMIRLPAFIIPQPDGMGSLSFVVPNLPGLVGASEYAQALLVQYPTLDRLTNWTADEIMQ